MSLRVRTSSVRAATALVAGALATCGGGPAARGGASLRVGAVLEHHGGPRRDGLYVDPTLTRAAAARFHLDAGFQAALAGPIYAQPLYVPGAGGPDLVVAASEQDEVAAFDAATGRRIWSRRLGTPVPGSKLPCGNLDPLGVTGTPIVDPATRTLYLDAMTTPDGGATKRHLVFALSVDDGSTRAGWPLAADDVVRRRGLAFHDAAQGQRGALALAGGTLYVPFGGHYGDCGDYHGWVLAIPTASPQGATAWETRARGGGIWAPSGLSSDGERIFAATGNTFDARTWGDGEAVLAFQAGPGVERGPVDSWAPRNWQDLDDADRDVGGAGPVPLDVPGARPSALVVQLGKDGNAYLLDRRHLGGIGGHVAVARVSRAAILGAAAAYATTRGAYVAFRGSGEGCPRGPAGELAAIRISPGGPPGAAVAWCARQNGRGSPMVTTTDGHAGAIVWSVGAEGDGRLHGFDGDTGEVVFGGGGDADALGEVARYQSPILGGGRIYVATATGVRAFTR